MDVAVHELLGAGSNIQNRPCRLQELGTVSAIALAAREQALLDAHAAGLIGDQLMLVRFQPAVCIGNHQVEEREVRQPYCVENGVEVARRLTAGGALYLDHGQQGISLITARRNLGANLAERLTNGAALVARALESLGVSTQFKAPNDLQVAGRQKIASVFLAERGESVLLFASIIVELDLKAAMQALLVPTEKLTVTGLEHAKERMTSLMEVLGVVPEVEEIKSAIAGAFGVGLRLRLHDIAGLEDDLDIREAKRNAPAWTAANGLFETKDKVPGATLRLLLGIDGANKITHAHFSTDGHFCPDGALVELGRELAGKPAADAARQAEMWFAERSFDSAGFGPADVVRLIERAVSKHAMQHALGLDDAQASGLMLAGPGQNPHAALSKANVMLVPYCAKPNWCKWRHTIDCVECGECEVGDAYTMARERNMEVITITNFEHLAETLDKMKASGVESYVGMCCGEFFLKRHHAFRESGMDAVLLDIEGATCYELKEENLAYAGKFAAEARLDLDAVKKVMGQVPVQPAAARPCISGILNRPGERARQRGQGSSEAAHEGCGACSCGKSAAAASA